MKIVDDETGEVLHETDDQFEAEIWLCRFIEYGHDAYITEDD